MDAGGERRHHSRAHIGCTARWRQVQRRVGETVYVGMPHTRKPPPPHENAPDSAKMRKDVYRAYRDMKTVAGKITHLMKGVTALGDDVGLLSGQPEAGAQRLQADGALILVVGGVVA